MVTFVDEEFFDKFGNELCFGNFSDTGLEESGSVAFLDVSVVSEDFVASLPEPFGAEFAGGGKFVDAISSDKIFDAYILVVVVTFDACLTLETSDSSSGCSALSDVLVLEDVDFFGVKQFWSAFV